MRTATEPVPCKKCQAAVLWVLTEAERPMPVNAEPAHGVGNLVLTLRKGQLHARAYDAETDDGRNRYLSHFATCPFAEQFRKGAAK